MKRTMLAVGFALFSITAFANTDAKNDTLGLIIKTRLPGSVLS